MLVPVMAVSAAVDFLHQGFHGHIACFFKLNSQRKVIACLELLFQIEQHHVQFVALAQRDGLARRDINAVNLEHAHDVAFHFHVVQFRLSGHFAGGRGNDAVVFAAVVGDGEPCAAGGHPRYGGAGVRLGDGELVVCMGCRGQRGTQAQCQKRE